MSVCALASVVGWLAAQSAEGHGRTNIRTCVRAHFRKNCWFAHSGFVASSSGIMLAHLAAFGRQGSRLSGRRRSLSAPHKSCALRFLCSSKSCTSNNVSSPRTQLGPDSILPHLPVSSHSKNLTSICSRLSRRRLSPRTNTELGGRRNFFSTETGGGGASSASALEAANNAARQAQLAYANAISTAKSNALFRKLFFITVPAGAFGGVAFFYWYTQERHEVKVQKAVIDPHLARKLEDLKPADTASHPYSSRSWVWKLFFIIARTAQLLWIWTPVICIAPVAALTGHKGLRKYLIKLLVKTTKRAGCSFVKFGQWVSMRPDIFAADIVAAMKHLMTDAPAHSYAETRRIIQESFGLSIEDLFDNFEAVPVASGSVAQVHRATLRPHQSPSGKPIVVAVKVLHPETLDETYIDIQIMTYVLFGGIAWDGCSLFFIIFCVLTVCLFSLFFCLSGGSSSDCPSSQHLSVAAISRKTFPAKLTAGGKHIICPSSSAISSRRLPMGASKFLRSSQAWCARLCWSRRGTMDV